MIQDQQVRFAVDAASIGVVGSTLLNWLPAWAAIFTIIWTGLQIYSWFKNRNWKRKE